MLKQLTFFECAHEMKLIVDFMHKYISDIFKCGVYFVGNCIINEFRALSLRNNLKNRKKLRKIYKL